MSLTLLLTPDLIFPSRTIIEFCQMACAQVFLSKTFIKTCCWLGCRRPSSVSRSYSQVASFAAGVKLMYSALVDHERATVGCLFEHQLTGPLLSMKIKSEVDFQLFLSPAQSELEYLSTSSLFWPSQVISRLFKSFGYCKIVFTASVCWWPGFFAKQLAMEVAKAMSGLVSTIENIRDPVIPQQRFFSDGNASRSIFYSKSAVFFIKILTAQALLKWNLLRILLIQAGCDSLIIRFSQSCYTFRPK